MRPRHLLIASLASALAATGASAASADNGFHHGGFGGHHWGHHRGRDFCRGDTQAGIAAMLAYGRRALSIQGEQRAQWDALERAVETAGATFDEACANPAAADAPADERLARFETLLEAGRAALAHVRPAFDALYAKLDDDQRRTLDGWLAEREAAR